MMKCQSADEVSRPEYAHTHACTLLDGAEESALENSYICIISLI